MRNKRLIILSYVVLTILVLGGAASLAIFTKPRFFSAVGSLVAGAAGVLAVIWFSAGLYYQGQQLKEQREQFLENFRQLREDGRRNALLLVKEILTEAEKRALGATPAFNSVNDLTSHYLLGLSELKIILESVDPSVVLDNAKRWMSEKEGPALFLMQGIKSAAEIYFRAVGKSDVDYSLDPELFVVTYGPTLWNIPYFQTYQGAATLLAEYMGRMKPARKGVELAILVALEKGALKGCVKEDAIIKDIREREKAGYSLPAIARDFSISSPPVSPGRDARTS